MPTEERKEEIYKELENIKNRINILTMNYNNGKIFKRNSQKEFNSIIEDIKNAFMRPLTMELFSLDDYIKTN